MTSKTKTTATKEEAMPALVPKLRFPEFRDSDDWQTKLLGGLCKIRTGKKDANEGASDGQYPFFTCAENHIFSHSYSFDAEAILIAGNANVGQTRYYSGKFEAYQRTYVLTDFSGISVPYLYAVLNAKLRESLLAHVQVSAMSYIKLPMLQEYALAVPPSPAEQQKIAECLSSVDELMAAQARKVDALKTHKKGLMQQLFPREGETQPRLRFPEFQNAGEWEVKPLGELGEIITGKTPSTKEADLWGGDILFITPTDISEEDKYQHTTARTVVETRSTKVLPEGSIVYTCIASIGKMALTVHPSITNQQINAVVPNEMALGEFLYYALANLTPWIKTIPATNTLPIINKTDFSKIAILHPDKAEQQRIVSCLSSLDALINAETQKLEALKTHKKALMQQLFPSPEEVAA